MKILIIIKMVKVKKVREIIKKKDKFPKYDINSAIIGEPKIAPIPLLL